MIDFLIAALIAKLIILLNWSCFSNILMAASVVPPGLVTSIRNFLGEILDSKANLLAPNQVCLTKVWAVLKSSPALIADSINDSINLNT